MIDLEFDTAAEAEALLAAMRRVWTGAGAAVSSNQRAWIVETVEAKAY
jgi:hypothetical protein